MIGREMGGYYYSEIGGTNIKYINSGMGKNNTHYAFEKKFSDIGINIHDPKYGVWLDNTLHNKLSQEYNKAWEKFFIDNPSYTAEQVMEYATKLMNDIFGQ